MSDDEYNQNHIRIFMKPIKDRPKSVPDLLKEFDIIHFMLTGWGH